MKGREEGGEAGSTTSSSRRASERTLDTLSSVSAVRRWTRDGAGRQTRTASPLRSANRQLRCGDGASTDFFGGGVGERARAEGRHAES